MKHLLLGLSIVIAGWAFSPTPEAEARSWRGWNHSKRQHLRRNHVRRYRAKKRANVPELDPSAAGSAMVLLLGGAAYVLSRRREDDLLSY